MFDEKITRRAFLGGTAKTAVALFCAPAIIRIDHLMKPYIPPEPVIELDPNSVNFIIQGLIPGSRVYIANRGTGEVLINEEVHHHTKGWNIPESGGEQIIARVRKPGYQSMQTTAGSPYPGGKTKIVLAQQLDLVYG